MKTFASYLVLTMLALALFMSGPASRGVAQSDTTLAELCLDGVVQIVRIGPDSQPVPPSKDCGAQHACCVLADGLAFSNTLPERSSLFWEHALAANGSGALVPRLEFLSADPRGPPAVQVGQIDQRKIRS